MGGVVPKGENNDELIDHLVEAKYINNKEVEKVFRAVDRGDFFPGDVLEDAYKDAAMRKNNLHMSAPCIYCEVMDNFELGPGLSFLNIGSGTGYLSTLAGLLLGPYGVNHGIDIYEDVLSYSRQKVEEFINYSDGFDSINFCKPQFVLGNVECMDSSFRKYDRIYCGARVYTDELQVRIKKLLKKDGILIYPFGENLMKYKRTSSTKYEITSLLHAQFSDLIERRPEDTNKIRIYSQPHTLKVLSRFTILKCLTKDRLHTLDELPLVKCLIDFLKYYKNPDSERPKKEVKVRNFPDEELSF